MLYVVGKKIDKSLVEKSGLYRSQMPSVEQILENTVANKGGNTTDYSVYVVTDLETSQNIYNALLIDLDWDEFDNIIKIDLSAEQNRRWVSVSANNEYILTGESIVFTGTVFCSDGETIDTAYDDVIFVRILTPSGPMLIRADFIQGRCVHTFTPHVYGHYELPLSNNNEGLLKVKNKCAFEYVYNFSNEIIS